MELNKQGVRVTAQEFRSFALERLRAFDTWAWKDAMHNPADYADYTKLDWWNMFLEFMENEFD